MDNKTIFFGTCIVLLGAIGGFIAGHPWIQHPRPISYIDYPEEISQATSGDKFEGELKGDTLYLTFKH